MTKINKKKKKQFPGLVAEKRGKYIGVHTILYYPSCRLESYFQKKNHLSVYYKIIGFQTFNLINKFCKQIN